jgi:hypothetical protein
MRTPIVEGKDATPVVDDQNRTVATMDNEPSLRLEFVKAPCEREFRRRLVDDDTSVVVPVGPYSSFWAGTDNAGDLVKSNFDFPVTSRPSDSACWRGFTSEQPSPAR